MVTEGRPDVPTVEGVSWVVATGGEVPEGALAGGEDSGSAVYVARADHEGAVIPGKLVQGHSSAYIPWGGEEHPKEAYEVFYYYFIAIANMLPQNLFKRMHF